MDKKYLYILITYIAMHLSGFIGIPALLFIGTSFFSVEVSRMGILATGIWVIFSFFIALVIILLMLRKENRLTRVEREEPMPLALSIVWAVGGIFLAFVAQAIAIMIEKAIGIEPGSENTQQLLQLIKLFPLVVVVSSVIGPILEEIVFRKVIFGALYNRFPFWVSVIISSFVFSIAHMEFTHFLLYAAMGFVFAFLYVKTKRIIVPIVAHVMMNTLVVVAQLFFAEDLQKMIDEAEKVQSFIGGLFL